MNTMEVTDYKEAYFRLKADIRTYRSPIKEMARYIDKMTMIGRQYSQLEGNIRRNLEEGEESQDLMDTFETEFSVLQQMIDVTIAGLNRNRLLKEAVDEGDRDMKDLIGDFKLVRLAVKAKAMGARSEMQEFCSRVQRQRVLC